MEPARDAQAAYQRYGPALVRKAGRVLGNRDDAIDVVHSLFADLVTRWTDDMDLAYLYKAVTNRCLNQLRDKANRARLLDKQAAGIGPQARVRCDDHVMGLDLIAKLADALDADHMATLVCRFVDDMTQDEVAAHLGVSRKTVGKRLDRIRDQVTMLLSEVAP